CSEILARGESFSAILASNDQLALGCLDRLQEVGIDCPGAVSLVGFNNLPLLDRIVPSLTTLAIQNERMGQEAAKLLLEQINNPSKASRSIRLKPMLKVRSSTAACSNNLNVNQK
ncbi:MAG: substrate-binding domain-containing protein, partial [Halopseudomonas sp.]